MPLLLLLAFVIVPVVELYVIVQVGSLIGVPETIVLLLALSVAGAWLVKREGLRAWRRFTQAMDEGRLPTREVVDGALVLLGGALLLTPGFVTDAFGLLLIAPPTRALLSRMVRSRAQVGFLSRVGGRGAPRGRASPPRRGLDDVVDVEVVDVRRNDRHPSGDA